METEPRYIHPDQLCIGLYVHLDLGWMRHSFTFSNFEIKDYKQIQKIRALGLDQIRYDPLRSKSKPLPLAAPETSAPPPAHSPPLSQPSGAAASPAGNKKLKLRTDRLMQLNKLVLSSKKDYLEDARMAREATLNFALNPKGAREKTEALVNDLIDSVITQSDVVLHAVSSTKSDPETYVHSLNVAVLALMLAKSLDMTEQESHELGVAALLHDIGKKTEGRTSTLLDSHCEAGAKLALESGLSERVAKIILQHHECMDGSGLPKHLSSAQIDPLARLLAIVNAYDNLCNPGNIEKALSPYEALAHMFNVTSKRYDAQLLQFFIRTLGVYPPGSIVQLSTGVYGVVMTANPRTPLLPSVMIYAPNVPRKTLVIIDLSEEDGITIKRCLKPRDLPADVHDYFNLRSRVNYYYLKHDLQGDDVSNSKNQSDGATG